MDIISETRVDIGSEHSSLKTNSALYKSDVLRFASSGRYLVAYLGQNLTWYFSRQQCSYNLSQRANKTKSDTCKNIFNSTIKTKNTTLKTLFNETEVSRA